MPKQLSRRTFLKAGLATAGAAAASVAPALPVQAAATNDLATMFDLRKCIGCESCVEACRESNQAKFPKSPEKMPTMYPTKRVKVEDWSSEDNREVTDRLTPYNWLYVQPVSGTHDGEEFDLNIPRRCMHCTNPPCANLCPWGAAYKQDNGIVRIDADICLGGSKCKKVCPWHIPQRQSGVGMYMDILPSLAGNGVMYKCDRCYDKIAEGGVPACIAACPENVQKIGPREEILKEAKALAKEIGGYIYGAEENGGTNTFYVSPVPFEAIDKAMTKEAGQGGGKGKGKGMGRGKPGMGPVEDSMAQVNNLVVALAVAPIAGAVGALGRFFKLAKNDDQTENKESGE